MVGNPAEIEKLKKSLINRFADQFSKRVYQYSLRCQLIQLYSSITRILSNFPITRDSHFVFGDVNERQVYAISHTASTVTFSDMYADELKKDPNTFKKRPRKLLSDDGKSVLNVWFIPHYTEILTLFKKNSDEMCYEALKYSVRIVGAFNDILHFLYANAWLNTEGASSVNTSASPQQILKKKDFSSWENAGGLGSELNDIQQEMNALNNPCDPSEVACMFELKRRKMFLQFDCVVRYAMRDTFLASGNVTAHKVIRFSLFSSSSCFILTLNGLLCRLSPNTCTIRSGFSATIRSPPSKMSILTCRMSSVPGTSAVNLCFHGVRSCQSKFLGRYLSLATDRMRIKFCHSSHGAYSGNYWPWYMIEPYMSLCVTALKDVEK